MISVFVSALEVVDEKKHRMCFVAGLLWLALDGRNRRGWIGKQQYRGLSNSETTFFDNFIRRYSLILYEILR